MTSRWLRALLLTMTLLASSCSSGDIPIEGGIEYKPPGVPLSISIDSDLNVEVSISGDVVTPIGTFTLFSSSNVSLDADNDWLIGVQASKGSDVHVYRIYSDEPFTLGPYKDVVIAPQGDRQLLLVFGGAGEIEMGGGPPGVSELDDEIRSIEAGGTPPPAADSDRFSGVTGVAYIRWSAGTEVYDAQIATNGPTGQILVTVYNNVTAYQVLESLQLGRYSNGDWGYIGSSPRDPFTNATMPNYAPDTFHLVLGTDNLWRFDSMCDTNNVCSPVSHI